MRAIALLCLLSATALAQGTPNYLVIYPDPPELNGADATLYNRNLLWNVGKTCPQRPVGSVWQCLSTREEVAAADAVLASRITTLESQVATAQSTANTAQAAASAAATAAASAQTAATAAQSAASTNASAISTLATRVTAAEVAITALQALPRRLCTSFTVAAGVSVPLTGISTVQNVPLAGVPAGAVCDTGAPTRMPLGARPDPVVTTAGTVAMAFVSNAGLLSSVISIPSGTYKVCCDSF